MWPWANRVGTIRCVGQGVTEGRLVATRGILLCIFGSRSPLSFVWVITRLHYGKVARTAAGGRATRRPESEAQVGR